MTSILSPNNTNGNLPPTTTSPPSSIQKPIRAPDSIKPHPRFNTLANAVWHWIHEASDASPVQPVCNLSTGFNEQLPPDFIRQQHADVLELCRNNQYAPITGIKKLKDSICQVYSPRYGRQLTHSEILIGSGANEALLSCVMAYLGPGDEVIVLEPAFPMYMHHLTLSGATIRYVPIRPPSQPSSPSVENVSAREWRVDLAELEAAITPRTKCFILNNPHNPLGKVFSREELWGFGELCVKHGLLILSDEVYERGVFDAPEGSPLEGLSHVPITSLSPEIAAHTVTAISLGKLFNATGWRLGFVVGPENVIEHAQTSHMVLAYSSSTPAQEACAAGLLHAQETDWWEVNRRDTGWRLRTVCGILDEVGLQYVVPDGTCFIWLDIGRLQIPADYEYPDFITKHHNSPDWKACYFMVQEIGVATIPGTCFYSEAHTSMGISFVRVGACKDNKGLELARERLLQLKKYL